jgi:long-chain fatty acid transport protein
LNGNVTEEREMDRKFSQFVLAVAAVLAVGISERGYAAGFALSEQSASGLGNAFAGAAATAEDASTIFFNPAGLAELKGAQFALAGHYIAPTINFANNGTSRAPTIATYSLGGDGGNAGSSAVVPNGYFSIPLNDRLTMGVGVNAPYGFVTEYDDTWVGRFQGIKSEVKSININPTLAIKVNDSFAIGVGVNYQKFETELTRKAATGISGVEFKSSLSADDTAWGYNFGVLVKMGDSTKLGVSYRSKLRFTLDGSVTVTSPLPGALAVAAAAQSGPSTVDLVTPDSFSVSLVHSLSDRTQLLADVTHTRWSEIQSLPIINTSTGATRDTLKLNFNDSNRYSFGVNHKCTDRFIAKVGVALDKSPVDDANRTVNLPDNDRTWLALGGKWIVSATAAVDFGYAHLSIKDAPIDQTRGIIATSGRVAGEYSGKIDIVSVQYTMSF